MPKLQRSPTQVTRSEVNSSESDAIATAPEYLEFPGRRQKRRRGSPGVIEDQLNTFKEDIVILLKEWKEELSNTLTTSMNKLSIDIEQVKCQMNKVELTTTEFEKSLSILANKYDTLNSKIETIEQEKKHNEEKIELLNTKIEELQRQLKSTYIEIRNVPSNKYIGKQDLNNITQNLFKNINVVIENRDVKQIYHINNKNNKGTVIVELATVELKSNILKATKELNKLHPSNKLNTSHLGIECDPIQPIYITESLTSNARKLFYQARDTAKTLNYKYCWTRNGKIFLRKAEGDPSIEIKNEFQFEELKKGT